MYANQDKFEAFCRQHRVQLCRFDFVDTNPHMPGKGANMDNWKISLMAGRRGFRFHFSQGYAFNGNIPEFRRVISALVREAKSSECPLEDSGHADYTGYDENPLPGQRSYRAAQRIRENLVRIFGEDEYNELARMLAGD